MIPQPTTEELAREEDHLFLESLPRSLGAAARRCIESDFERTLPRNFMTDQIQSSPVIKPVDNEKTPTLAKLIELINKV